MVTLKELYKFVETSKLLGIELGPETHEQISELEEEIIEEDVLPAILSEIQPLLTAIQRNITLIIEHIPGEPISIKMTREQLPAFDEDLKQLETVETKPILEPELEFKGEDRKSYTIPKHKKGPRTKLEVTLPNGKVVNHHLANVTFMEVIEYLGIQQVQDLNITVNKRNLINNYGPDIRGAKKLSNGMYLDTHSSTQAKMDQLQEINTRLGAGLKIRKVLK